MLPLLQFATDGKEKKFSEAIDFIAEQFKLTQEERAELLPSGNQSRFDNRVGWSRTHLKNAGLIEYVRRGVFKISKRGQQVLAQKPKIINLKFLNQFPEFVEFRKKRETAQASPSIQIVGITPEEQMAQLAQELRTKLADELLEQIRTMNPYRFERLVLDLLLAMGYGGSREEAATVTQKSGDEGIDGLINEDRLGLDCIYLQAKRWQNSVGRPDIQSFVGALDGKRAEKGIFITTSNFGPTAVEFTKSISKRVILIDGARLAELMIQHNVGVSLAYAYEVKRIDSDYFEES
ncbi:MAG: restriction endonuclease [Limisphaerales bacterium]